MLKPQIAIAVAAPMLLASLAFAQDSYRGDDGGRWERDTAEARKERCAERYARRVGRLAYIEARLSLNDQQRPVWTKWRQFKLDVAEQRRTRCIERTTRREEAPATALEREARRERRLAARLQELQASRPALQALYDSLNAEQKASLDRALLRKGHRRQFHGGGSRERM